jgi:drug/metabolite transporter (DMT)-like permease
MKVNSKATLFALLAVGFWSTVATSFKLALKGMPFYELLFISTWTSVIIFFIFLLLKKQLIHAFRCSIKEWLNSALMGALNPFMYYLILFKAYSLLPAYMAQPLNYTWPVVLVFFSAIFLKQRLSWLSFVALIIAFIGVIFISNGNSNQHASVLGVILATGSSLIWSSYWILNMKDSRQTLPKLFLNFLFGAVYITVFILFSGLSAITSFTSLSAAVYVGFFEMGLTFLLWMYALNLAKRTDKISIYVFLSPFISLIFITTILGESITINAIIGFIFIASGILISKWKEIINFGNE